jgi:outer membrane PBP1 activator LpoA protein
MPTHLVNVIRLLVLVMLVLLVLGCSTKPQQQEPVAIETKSQVNIDKRLLEPCDSLSKPKSASETDVLDFVSQTTKTYRCLVERNEGLRAIVKKAFNI